MNNITLTGRLTKETELRYLQKGTPVASNILAVRRDYKNKQNEYDTDFIHIEVMGKQAEVMANYTDKGMRIGVQGALRIDSVQNQDGTYNNYTKVQVRSLDLIDTIHEQENRQNTQNNNKGKGKGKGKNQGYQQPQGYQGQQPPQGYQQQQPPQGYQQPPQGFEAINDEDIPF